MKYEDQKLMRQICEEMGIKWNLNSEYATVGGVDIRAYLEEHDVLEFGNSNCLLVSIKVPEGFQIDQNFEPNNNMVLAA